MRRQSLRVIYNSKSISEDKAITSLRHQQKTIVTTILVFPVFFFFLNNFTKFYCLYAKGNACLRKKI